MTTLRQKFIRDLALRGRAPRTQETYVRYIADLAMHYGRSPDGLGGEQIADWLYHLKTARRFSPSSLNLAVCACRFFYGTTLGRSTENIKSSAPRCRDPRKIPHVYSPEQIERLLTAGCTDPRDRAFLMTVYAAGLRLREACMLGVEDVDSARNQLRIRHAKGGRERCVTVSAQLMDELRVYWLVARKRPWLFFAPWAPERPMGRATAQSIYYRAVRRAGLARRGGIHTLRHSYATHLLENGVEITLVQRQLRHGLLSTTALYLHVREERLAQIKNPLGLIHLGQAPAKMATAEPSPDYSI